MARSIIVAVIAVNALAFFSECAAFDNVFRDAVRVHATSPAAGQGIEQSSALVQTALSAAFDAENEAVRVSAEGVSGGHTRFTGTLEYMPTLFGLGLRSTVFGIDRWNDAKTSEESDRVKHGVCRDDRAFSCANGC